MKNSSAAKIKLTSFDDLFRTQDQEEAGGEIVYLPIKDLHPFRNHPFRVLDDEKMEETAESIRRYGVLVPGIVRVRPEGGYEILAGHRRKRGCEIAGKDTMPVFIRDYDDDQAVEIMVDTNIQREDILPSERAKAYRMKYEAMKHQGKGDGRSTLNEMGEAAGESGKTVQRYIWLSRLTDALLSKVDDGTMGMTQGVDLSFLTAEMQGWVEQIVAQKTVSVSMAQSAKLKEYARNGQLTQPMIELILSEKKAPSQKITIKADKLREYFPEEYTSKEMEAVIFKLLEEWKQGSRR
jgi:ParB family chromosome partitioning protein